MQLTIIGAGAIGGTIGAHLIRDGHDILRLARLASAPPRPGGLARYWR